MTSFSRPIASVLVGLALLVLSACAPQTQTVPPVADVELPAPTKDIWQAFADGDMAELAANKRAGADLDGLMRGAARVTALTVAVVTGQSGAVKWLLANGASTNARNGDGSTALGAAAFLGRAEMAKILIRADIDSSIRNDSGQSALDIASVPSSLKMRV